MNIIEDKLKVYLIGVKYYFTTYKGLFAKKINHSDSIIDDTRIIIAKSLEEAKYLYGQRYSVSEEYFPRWMINFENYKITNVELVECIKDRITFDTLKNKVNYADFIKYIKQELSLENQITEAIEK